MGLISSIAYGVSFSFSLNLDKQKHCYNITFKGHFYGIITVIENTQNRNNLLKQKVIKYNKNINVMVNEFAYKISKHFLIISNLVKSHINIRKIRDIYYGIHLRTGKADGKEFLLLYLKYNHTTNILRYINSIKKKRNVYVSSDSSKLKNIYKKCYSLLLSKNTSNI